MNSLSFNQTPNVTKSSPRVFGVIWQRDEYSVTIWIFLTTWPAKLWQFYLPTGHSSCRLMTNSYLVDTAEAGITRPLRAASYTDRWSSCQMLAMFKRFENRMILGYWGIVPKQRIMAKQQKISRLFIKSSCILVSFCSKWNWRSVLVFRALNLQRSVVDVPDGRINLFILWKASSWRVLRIYQNKHSGTHELR